MAFTLVPLIGTFTSPGGSGPAQGTLELTLSEEMTNGGVTKDTETLEVSLNNGGVLNFEIEANDDTGTTPTGTFYIAVLRVTGADDLTFEITVSAANASAGQQISASLPSNANQVIG
jgi:hypothetical protein